MCGIVVILNFDKTKIKQQELKNFNNSLRHRGPDYADIYIDHDETIGLGHRRLNIIDLSSLSNQPFFCSDRRYIITYNGEIYNFLEIKKELKAIGVQFKTNGDTEVLLNAYKQWGEKCQYKFNGMWAFAIWDNKKKSMFVSRDRFGVKPLYYYIKDNKKFYFASELKAFMHLNFENKPKFNYSKIVYSAKNWSNSSPSLNKNTFLKNVKEILPGHSMTINENHVISEKKWWSTIDNLIEVPKNNQEKIDKFREIFFSSCKIRMRSDVDIGTCLSGGLDSSSVIVAILNLKNDDRDRYNKKSITNAFILNYVGEKNLDLEYAKEVVQNTKIKPKIVNLDFNKIDPAELIKIIYYQEDLSGNDGVGPWNIYKSLKENKINVSIDGHGGDELLAGYDGYTYFLIKECLNGKNFLYLMESLKFHLSKHYNNSFKDLILKRIFSRFNTKITNKYDFFIKNNDDKMEEIEKDNISNLSLLNKELYNDYHYKSLQKNLKIFDRFSMAHGVESRNPFLDWRLASYSFSLTSNYKIKGGFNKRILREAMKGLLKEKVLFRTDKKGFHLYRTFSSYKIKNFINDTIRSKDFLENETFNAKKLLKFTETHKDINFKKIFKYLQVHFLLKTFQRKGF